MSEIRIVFHPCHESFTSNNNNLETKYIVLGIPPRSCLFVLGGYDVVTLLSFFLVHSRHLPPTHSSDPSPTGVLNKLEKSWNSYVGHKRFQVQIPLHWKNKIYINCLIVSDMIYLLLRFYFYNYNLKLFDLEYGLYCVNWSLLSNRFITFSLTFYFGFEFCGLFVKSLIKVPWTFLFRSETLVCSPIGNLYFTGQGLPAFRSEEKNHGVKWRRVGREV